MAKNYRIEWRGKAVRTDVVNAVIDGVTEFGLKHETESKRELRPGHGKLTGTLQRSIHAAEPDYNFGADNVKSGTGAPERSSQGGGAKESGDKVSITVGSGMIYARRIEELFSYMRIGFDKVQAQLIPILKKHMSKKGFK